MNDYELELDDEELENCDNDIDNDIDNELDEDYDEEKTTDSSIMSPEEAGYTDGFFDAQLNTDYLSFGASIDLDSLTDDEHDEYEQAYLSSLYSNKKH